MRKIKKAFSKLSKEQKVKAALFAAELVLPIHELHHPGDNKVREIINDKKRYICGPFSLSFEKKNKEVDSSLYAAFAACSCFNYVMFASRPGGRPTLSVNDGKCIDAIRYAIKAGVKKKAIISAIKHIREITEVEFSYNVLSKFEGLEIEVHDGKPLE